MFLLAVSFLSLSECDNLTCGRQKAWIVGETLEEKKTYFVYGLPWNLVQRLPRYQPKKTMWGIRCFWNGSLQWPVMYVGKTLISKLYRQIAKQLIRILKNHHSVLKTIPRGLKMCKGFYFYSLKETLSIQNCPSPSVYN